jgi:hypothetical protein
MPHALPVGTRIERVACQAFAAVDDTVLSLRGGGRVFVQAKRNVVGSDRPRSALFKALDQFVRQAKECAEQGEPLNPDRDRLVLAAGPNSSDPIRNVLRRLLQTTRNAGVATLSATATTEPQRAIARVVEKCLTDSWRQHYGMAPVSGDLHPLLQLIHIVGLDVEDGEPDELRLSVGINESGFAEGDSRGYWCTLYRGDDRRSIDQIPL